MSYFEVLVRRLVSSMCVLSLCCGASSMAFADASSASLNITVSDTSGAVISDAIATLRNRDTTQQQTALSSTLGSANFPFLKPGHYDLTLSKAGFADLTVNSIVLNVGDEKHLDIKLKVGPSAQTVTVDGSGLTINTTDASVGTVIDQKFVENIPLNGRSFQDLIAMTPGIITQSPQAQSAVGNNGDFSVNGQRTESNYYTVDGVSANISPGNGSGQSTPGASGSLSASTALGTTQSIISVDALQEFRVQSSTYSAAYGRTPGGQFSFITRSGTNEVHGSAFDYLRNNYFDANDWFNDLYGKPEAALRQNDFGGTLGGPIRLPRIYDGRKDTFFFASYEGLRLTQPQAAQTLYVPDTFMRQLAAPALQPILNAFPLQNGTDYGTSGSPSLAQFISSYSIPSRIDSTSLRVDQHLTPKAALFFRYGYTPTSTDTRSLSALSELANNASTYTLGFTGQVTDTIATDVRMGYAKSSASLTGSIDSFGGATPINLPSTMGIAGYSSPQPYILLYISGIGLSTLTYQDSNNQLSQWNINDTTSISSGHHQISFGGDYRRLIATTTPSSPLVLGEYLSASSVAHNSASYLEILQRIQSQPIFNELALFAQDEWRVNGRLHLSFGLRWELDPPPTGANGKDAYTLAGNIGNPSSLTLAPLGTPLWHTYRYNFAPRLGMAWATHADPDWQTVVRAGGGIFFDSANEPTSVGWSGIGFSAQTSSSGGTLPITPSQLAFGPSVTPPYTSSVVTAYPSHLQLPYTWQWNLSVEQAVTRTASFTLSYIGANGRRLIGEQQLTLTQLNPNFGSINYFPNNVTSNYQALQVQLQRAVTKGVQALGAYTWSHAIDFGSNASVVPLARGNSDFDVRSSFSAGLSWDISFPSNSTLLKRIGGKWGVDGRMIARTAFPVTLGGSYLTNTATGQEYYSGVNLVAGQPLYLRGSSCPNLPGGKCPGGKAINKSAFTPASGTVAGNAPRNFVRGFGETEINLAARREFHIYERFNLQFRAEAFNILNHPTFGYVDSGLTDLTFGQSTKMLNQSLGTLASQFQQGGPRSMQFALKLIF